jgi:hypothetical protein
MSNPVGKHSPPCKAHLLLVEMFENGKITAKTTPKENFSFHAESSKFSLAVFSNNFRQFKLLNGLECMSHFLKFIAFFISHSFTCILLQ